MKISTKQLSKFFRSTAIMLLSATSSTAYADEINNKTEEEPKPIVKVLSVATGDWNEDKRIDSAVLMKSEDIVELYLYLANEAGEQEELAHKKDIVWSGEMAGTLPYLKTNKKSTSLFIHAENDSIGRNRWSQRLTVSYRDKDFIVTGYTYEDRDTLEPEKESSCDVNLVTGKGFKNKKAFEMAEQKIKLEDWTEENIPKQCQSED